MPKTPQALLTIPPAAVQALRAMPEIAVAAPVSQKKANGASHVRPVPPIVTAHCLTYPAVTDLLAVIDTDWLPDPVASPDQALNRYRELESIGTGVVAESVTDVPSA